MWFFGTFRRRLILYDAFRFGREFYDLDLENLSQGITDYILIELKRLGVKSPQETFFMLVAAFLGVLDDFKRFELYDGLIVMRTRNAIHDEIYDNFMLEFERANASQPGDWVRDALINRE